MKPAVCKRCAAGSNADRRNCSACGRLCCRHLSVARDRNVIFFVKTIHVCGPCNLRERGAARAAARKETTSP